MIMELSDLRIFSTVVREGGITRAAERLHRVQSNVTTRIRQLEEKLGVKLFIREGKRLHLSPAGRILLEYSDRLLDLSEEAERAVRDLHPRGTFRLGAMESTAAVRLPAPLTAYNDRFPDVTIELQTGNPVELCRALLAGDIEAALIAAPVAEAKFDFVVAFDEEPVIVTAQNYPEITDTEGTPKTMIVFEHGCPHRRQLEAWYEERDELPDRTLELGSYHAMLGCVLAGMGAALVPKSVLASFAEAHRLRIYDLPPGQDRLPTLLTWRKGARSSKIDGLVEILNGSKTAAA